MIARALSSVGSEHLVYTQRVGGSNPSAPTKGRQNSLPFFYFLSTSPFPKNSNEGERVRNAFTRNFVPSNPSAPTEGRQNSLPFFISNQPLLSSKIRTKGGRVKRPSSLFLSHKRPYRLSRNSIIFIKYRPLKIKNSKHKPYSKHIEQQNKGHSHSIKVKKTPSRSKTL